MLKLLFLFFRIARKTPLGQVATFVQPVTMVTQQMGYHVKLVNVQALIGIMQVAITMEANK